MDVQTEPSIGEEIWTKQHNKRKEEQEETYVSLRRDVELMFTAPILPEPQRKQQTGAGLASKQSEAGQGLAQLDVMWDEASLASGGKTRQKEGKRTGSVGAKRSCDSEQQELITALVINVTVMMTSSLIHFKWIDQSTSKCPSLL